MTTLTVFISYYDGFGHRSEMIKIEDCGVGKFIENPEEFLPEKFQTPDYFVNGFFLVEDLPDTCVTACLESE